MRRLRTKMHFSDGLLPILYHEMALRHVSVLEGACCGGGSHTKDEAAALRLAPKLNLIHLRRQRLAGSEPMAIEDVVLPPSFSWLLDLDLANGSLHQAPTDHGY